MSNLRDSIFTKDNSEIIMKFYAHASVGIEWKGVHIYIDPVGEKYGIDFSNEPKADLILVTHQHSDHLDIQVIEELSKPDTKLYVSKECLNFVSADVLKPFEAKVIKGIEIYSVLSYNITPSHIQYHPKHNEGLGYVINIGGTNIYVAGDTEDNTDVLSLKNIDIAFLPVNQPYTMTIEQVVNVVDKIRPTILYPYHTASQMGETDVHPLVERLDGICDVRIRNMK